MQFGSTTPVSSHFNTYIYFGRASDILALRVEYMYVSKRNWVVVVGLMFEAKLVGLIT